MVVPAEIIIGASTTWDDVPTNDSLGNVVDSSLWTLKYEFRGPTSLTITAATNGTGWRSTLTVTASAALTAGTYYWQAIATKGSPTVTDRLVLATGQMIAKANLTGVSGTYDGRSQAVLDLAAVQAAIRALSTGGVKSYTIGTRQVTRVDMADLLLLESQLKAQVVKEQKAEKIAAGLGNPNNLFVRFNKR